MTQGTIMAKTAAALHILVKEEKPFWSSLKTVATSKNWQRSTLPARPAKKAAI